MTIVHRDPGDETDHTGDSAEFSADRVYRYTLTRQLGLGPTLMVIGLNPSTADERQDDPTIRRCLGFARRWEMGRLVMTNIFAFRATWPATLYSHTADPIGPHNDQHLLERAGEADLILAAWGAHGGLLDRDQEVRTLLQDFTLMCLGRTLEGFPKHPLYLAAKTEPTHFAGPQWADDDTVTLTEKAVAA